MRDSPTTTRVTRFRAVDRVMQHAYHSAFDFR
jgi:hypothetical protein